jgi:hypothetical protein
LKYQGIEKKAAEVFHNHAQDEEERNSEGNVKQGAAKP